MTAPTPSDSGDDDPLVADAILSDEEIERRADTFNLDSDDWSSYVHHWKGYRDGLSASRAALLAARRGERDARRLAAAVLRFFDPNRHSAIRDAFGYEQSATGSKVLREEMLALSTAIAAPPEET